MLSRGDRMNFKDFTPAEVTKNERRIILTGRGEMLMEGHGGLFSYETRHIRLKAKPGLITVNGNNLTIEHFGAQDLLIRGTVDSVQFDGEQK